MMRRSLFGWSLVACFCAAISCGGGGDSTPKGFGVKCSDDTTCEAYDLLCGDGKCVQCLDDTDCRSAEVCTGGICKAPVDCDSSSDCTGEQVCSQDLGACVDCVTSKDCKTGQACMDHSCHDRPTCDFTSDCDRSLVCEPNQHICVECRTTDDCGYKQVCEEYECVSESTGTGGKGSGGSGGKGGNGGTSSAGTSSSGTGNGGTTTAGAAGKGGSGGMSGGGMGGMSGTVGEGGVGGSVDCGCALDDVCTPDQRCVAPTLIDDLEDCNDQIIDIEGRHGNWAAAADTGVDLMSGFTNPGSGWTDMTCAAWATGSEISLNNPNTKFAFIGFRLNVDDLDAAHVYDLSPYNGIQVKLESASDVQVVVKTSGGGYFQVTLPPFGGSNLRTAPFASMTKMNNSLESPPIKLDTVTEIQFSVTTPKDFRLAVHRVELY